MSFYVHHVKGCMSDVKELDIGVLYALRSKYPTIDGVGLLNQKYQNYPWLVFAQVSLQDYSKHSKLLTFLANQDIVNQNFRRNYLHIIYISYMSLVTNHKNIILIICSTSEFQSTFSVMTNIWGNSREE